MSRAFIAGVVKATLPTTSNEQAKNTANLLLGAIAQHLKSTGKFSVPGFGTFAVKWTKARKGYNPMTGKAIQIEAGKTVRFKASKKLKATV